MKMTLTRAVIGLLLLGGAAAADTNGQIAAPQSSDGAIPDLPDEPAVRPFQGDDRLQPHGTDAARNWPVPHPERPLDVQAIQPAYAFKGLTAADRILVQSRLATWGYYRGPVDGLWTADLWAAVEAYAAELDLSSNLDDKAGSLAVFRHIAS